jgi:hypothetical protein
MTATVESLNSLIFAVDEATLSPKEFTLCRDKMVAAGAQPSNLGDFLLAHPGQFDNFQEN